MFSKRKKLSSGSGVLASERLKGAMHDQRKLLDFEEGRRVNRIEFELERLRAMKSDRDTHDQPACVLGDPVNHIAPPASSIDRGDHLDFDLPPGWSALSDDENCSLRDRFSEEEQGLFDGPMTKNGGEEGFDLELPQARQGKVFDSTASLLNEAPALQKTTVAAKKESLPVALSAPAQKREVIINRSTKGSVLKADAGLGFYDFGLGEVVSGSIKMQEIRRPKEVSFVEHIQHRESLRMDMHTAAVFRPSSAGQASAMLSVAVQEGRDEPELKPTDIISNQQESVELIGPSLEFDEDFSKKIDLLESNLNAPRSDLDPYDLDFRVDSAQVADFVDADDNVPVLTDIITEGKLSTGRVMKSKYGATQSVSIISLLYSWAFSLSGGKRSIAVVKSLEILNDPHQPNDLEYFSAPDFHGPLWAHSLGKLNTAPSSLFSPAGIFHIFRPKLLPSEERGRFSLMTREPGSEPFFKWFTPVSPKSTETCVDAFAYFTLDKISRSLGARTQILWDSARALKSLDLEASPSLRNDVRVMTKVYELTGSMLTPSLLHSLSQSMPDSGLTLQSWLLTHDSSKSIDWVEVPWGDHPVEIILFHLLGQIAADKRMSLSSLRVLALLDSMLVNTDKMSRYTDAEISVCAVYESHERSSALENPSSDRSAFVGKHLFLIDSEKLDSRLYENPMLEISWCDDRSFVSGPFLKTIVERFSSMHEKLLEIGLLRPELLVLSQKMQQID